MVSRRLDVTDVRKKLTDLPKATELFDEVYAFYADTLRFLGNESGTVSTYRFDTDAEHLRFRSVTIELALNTDRLPAAVTHELFHLRLRILGYPQIRSFALDVLTARIGSDLAETFNRLLNVVDHDIFVGDFLDAGLPLSQFLGAPASPKSNYKAQWREMQRNPTPPELMFVWWNWWTLEYLRHLISREHGSDVATAAAEQVEKWGARALPGFQKETAKIRDWIKAGNHKNPQSYPGALRQLASLMRLPNPSFLLVEKAGSEISLRAID